MANFSDLPTEVQIQIIEETAEGKPSQDMFFVGEVLPELCLVNRRWNLVSTPILYAQYSNDLSQEQDKSLRTFFRTIITRPDLAGLVKQINFTSTGLQCAVRNDFSDMTADDLFFKENSEYIQQAIKQAGFDLFPGLEDKAESELKKGNPLPLVALILAHCPSLSRLQLHVWPETLRARDPFFNAIIDFACGKGNGKAKGRHKCGSNGKPSAVAFQNLESLYVAPKGGRLVVMGAYVPHDRVQVSNLRPYYDLPKLKELYVWAAEMSDGIDEIEPAQNSCLGELTLMFNEKPDESLGRFLSYFTNLKQLSLFLPAVRNDGMGPSFHQELWNKLLPLKDQLEYLDIQQHGFIDEQREHDPFCPPLAEFTKLRQLSTSVLILEGIRCPHESPCKLRSHLPPSLQSLGVSCNTRHCVGRCMENFDQELANIALAAPEVPLRCIVLQVSTMPNRQFFPLLRAAAEAKKILVFGNEETFLWGGGLRSPFARFTYVHEPKEDLKEYLEEIRSKGAVIPKGMIVHGMKGRLE